MGPKRTDEIRRDAVLFVLTCGLRVWRCRRKGWFCACAAVSQTRDAQLDGATGDLARLSDPRQFPFNC